LIAQAALRGGSLLRVLKENPEHVAYLRAHHVDWRAPWPRNTEALDYYREHASRLGGQLRAHQRRDALDAFQFPSKLIEYCHLGLPIVIVAADDTAVVHWARARKFSRCLRPGDAAGIAGYVTRLRDPAFCRERAALSRSFARGEFDPVAIQRQLTESLLRI